MTPGLPRSLMKCNAFIKPRVHQLLTVATNAACARFIETGLPFGFGFFRPSKVIVIRDT